ncbi:unnamed protein product [Orchesella dallaii]|uniref:Uncharacterized protein n=1 Tax=Orchesella dallaii TaxID=48710 RepID=A0ABP1Q674_9HEXA
MFPHYYGNGLIFVTKVSSNNDDTNVIIFSTCAPNTFRELWELEDDLVQNAPVIIVLTNDDLALLHQHNLRPSLTRRVIVIRSFLDLHALAWVNNVVYDITRGMASAQSRRPTSYDRLKVWADILGLHVYSYWYLVPNIHTTLRYTIRYDRCLINHPFNHEAFRTEFPSSDSEDELVPELQEPSDTDFEDEDENMEDPNQNEANNIDQN